MHSRRSTDHYLEFIDHERASRIFLWLGFGAGTLLASLAWLHGERLFPWLIGSISVLCALLLGVHRLGHPRLAGQILIFFTPVAVTAILLEGSGLHDPGVLGFGITIVFGSLLGGRRMIIPVTAVVLALVCLVFWAEKRGRLGPFEVTPTRPPDGFDLAVVLVLILIVSALTWVVLEIVERNMERVRASEQEVNDAYDLTLEGWARALELRDKETEGHSRRVTDLTVMVAESLGISGNELTQIRRGALLHDIGKMGVPDKILHKPAPLDDAEWEVVRRHTTYARELLEPIEFLQGGAISIPYSHHEAWDGSGYPEGLRGEAIPRAARIFALADNWDALTHDRPYRSAWTPDQTVEYFEQEAGRKFDPELVPVFLSIARG